MPFEAQQFDLRGALIGPKKETTYGTALLDASLTHRLRFDKGAFAEITRQYISDIDHAGKGHPFPTFRQVQEVGAQWQSGNLEVTDFIAGWLLAFSMGHEVVSGAGPFVHTFTFENATNICPVTTVFFRDTADVLFKLSDLFISDLEISGAPTGPLMSKFSMAGSGKRVDGDLAGGFANVALPTWVPILGSDTDVQIGAVGAPVSIKERVKSWTAKITTNVIVHRGSGGGLFATMHKFGIPKLSLQLVVAAKDVDDLRTLFLNDTLQEVLVSANSGASAQLSLDYKGVYLSAAKLGLDGPDEVWTLTSDDRGLIKNGANEVLTAVVTNGQATSYLTAG